MSSIIRATTTSGLQVAPDNSGSLQLQTNGTTTAVTIDTSQNVGIGASTITSLSPNYTTVQLQGSSGSGITWFVGSTRYAYSYVDSGGFITQTANATPLVLGTNGTERMRIDSDGNVGFGAPAPAGVRMYLSGTDMPIQILNSAGTNQFNISYSTAQIVSFETYHASGSNIIFKTSPSGGGVAERLRISSTGTLTSQATYDNTAAGSTVVVTSAGLIRRTSSSLKYKKDVETLEQTIVDNAVNNLRPVWYRTKNADGDDKATWSHIGLIAEEVDLVEPRLVKYKTVEVTQDENGANVTTELETPVPEDVDYAKLSVILLAKVKQLEARIAILEAK
jgi:hypothetical protein